MAVVDINPTLNLICTWFATYLRDEGRSGRMAGCPRKAKSFTKEGLLRWDGRIRVRETVFASGGDHCDAQP